MPAKKKAAETAEASDPKADKKAAKRKAADKSWAVYADERARTTAQLEADQAALINAPAKVKPDAEGDIDARMAALEADHKKMGAR